MGEEVATAPAESSPAEPSKQQDVTIPTDPEAYAEWRQSGKVPESKPPSKREASASSKPSVDDESETAPVSETGKKGRNAEQRIKDLVSERDTYRTKLEALEAGKKDASGTSSPAPAKDAKAESSPAPQGQQRPVKPKQEDFDSWDKYDSAIDQYHEDLADFKASQRIEADRQRQRHDAATQEMQKRLDAAKERYGEEAESKIIDTAKTVFEDQAVPPAIKTALGRSEVLVDALYVMQSDAQELTGFLDLARKDPLEALRKWFTIETLVAEELGKGKSENSDSTPSRGADGKFLSEKPARRSAPAPPVELNGNTSPTGDQTERAANAGNFSAFREMRNRQDLQKQRGQ